MATTATNHGAAIPLPATRAPKVDLIAGYIADGYRSTRPHPDDADTGRTLPCSECNGECSVRSFRKDHGETTPGYHAFTYAVVRVCCACGHQEDM